MDGDSEKDLDNIEEKIKLTTTPICKRAIDTVVGYFRQQNGNTLLILILSMCILIVLILSINLGIKLKK